MLFLYYRYTGNKNHWMDKSLQTVQHEKLLQDFGLTRLPDLPCQEHLVHDAVNLSTNLSRAWLLENIIDYLVEIEHKVQLTHVVKIFIQYLE